ncbi:hypothetical protein INR49_015449, partial [Caranx melampygus]
MGGPVIRLGGTGPSRLITGYAPDPQNQTLIMGSEEKAATTFNSTFVRPAYFYVSGFSNLPHVTYFYVFLCFVYIMTVVGNGLLLSLICLVKTLHTPKYMIVFNLALTDLCGSTALVPKLLDMFLFDRRYIVYEACLSYMFFVLFFVSVQSWTLVTMAYDRFIAICFPLRYHSIVTKPAIAAMLLFTWLFLLSLIGFTVGLIDRLSFCGSVVVKSFFCDHGPVYLLACNNTSLNNIMAYVAFITLICCPLILIAITYICISIALSRIASAAERLKAFKTCTSHLILVAIFFLPIVGTNIAAVATYIHPNARIINSSLTHTIPALLNPIIYSLKTEEVLNSLKKLCKRSRLSNRFMNQTLIMGSEEKAATTFNSTFVRPAYFYVSGFSNLPHVTYFYVFLCFVYIMTVVGNGLLLSLICLVKTLHTPKYMIVFNLALTDLCGSTALVPKLLDMFLFDRRYIVYEACLSYMFFVLFFVSVQSWTLVTMAYDRFIAICFPLRYHSIVTKPAIAAMLLFTWIFLLSLVGFTVGLIDRLSFCGSVVVKSFFCDHGPVYYLACNNTSLNNIMAYVAFITLLCCPLILIAITYICISIALSRIASAAERLKAFKTCTSHLILVAIFFLPIVGTNIAAVATYIHPNARIINSSLTHTIPALLNPIIYSLKTEEVLNSLKKLCKRSRLSNVTSSKKRFMEYTIGLTQGGMQEASDKLSTRWSGSMSPSEYTIGLTQGGMQEASDKLSTRWSGSMSP